MWGAKSGKEQLPPFPEPTFAAGFACGVPRAAVECVVGFQSVEAFDKAHQMVRSRTPRLVAWLLQQYCQQWCVERVREWAKICLRTIA